MVEQIGSGIGRMKTFLKKAKLPAPVFKMDGMFTVIFQRTVEKTAREILNSMLENPHKRTSRKNRINKNRC